MKSFFTTVAFAMLAIAVASCVVLILVSLTSCQKEFSAQECKSCTEIIILKKNGITRAQAVNKVDCSTAMFGKYIWAVDDGDTLDGESSYTKITTCDSL